MKWNKSETDEARINPTFRRHVGLLNQARLNGPRQRRVETFHLLENKSRPQITLETRPGAPQHPHTRTHRLSWHHNNSHLSLHFEAGGLSLPGVSVHSVCVFSNTWHSNGVCLKVIPHRPLPLQAASMTRRRGGTAPLWLHKGFKQGRPFYCDSSESNKVVRRGLSVRFFLKHFLASLFVFKAHHDTYLCVYLH